MFNEASLNKILPAALILNDGILISTLFCHCGSFSFIAVWEQANWAPSTEALAAAFSKAFARSSASRCLRIFFRLWFYVLFFSVSDSCILILIDVNIKQRSIRSDITAILFMQKGLPTTFAQAILCCTTSKVFLPLQLFFSFSCAWWTLLFPASNYCWHNIVYSFGKKGYWNNKQHFYVKTFDPTVIPNQKSTKKIVPKIWACLMIHHTCLVSEISWPF